MASRRVDQSPSFRSYGAYCAKTLMVCLPFGATLGSYAVWKYSSAHPGAGSPALQRSNAAWVASILVVTVTMARWGRLLPGAALNSGSRDSPQLSFTTGLVDFQASIRARQASGTPSSHSAMVRFGSALETTSDARISSPPASRTPSPGTIDPTGTPAASTAPLAAAASAIANDTRPIPPRTYPQRPFASVPMLCMRWTPAVPG